MLRVYIPQDMRFTTKSGAMYAILIGWPPNDQTVITSLASGKAEDKVDGVTLLGDGSKLQFSQEAEGLKVKMPVIKPCDYAHALKITGLKL